MTKIDAGYISCYECKSDLSSSISIST